MAAVTGAAIGLAATGISTAMSFTQAAKQQQLYRQANAKAEQAMQQARQKLEVNYMDQLSIMKEPYELQRQAMLVQGAQSIEAAKEADRGAAATAGRLQAMQNEQQQGIRTAMGQELMGLEKLSADEESRLRDINVQLDLGEVQGAQLAAADAQEARSAAMTQGFQGMTQMAGYAAEMVPLYMQNAAGKQLGKQEAAYNAAASTPNGGNKRTIHSIRGNCFFVFFLSFALCHSSRTNKSAMEEEEEEKGSSSSSCAHQMKDDGDPFYVLYLLA